METTTGDWRREYGPKGPQQANAVAAAVFLAAALFA